MILDFWLMKSKIKSNKSNQIKSRITNQESRMELVVVVLGRHCRRQIDHRQLHEDECLQRPDDQAEEHDRQRDHERNDAGEDQDDELFAKDIAEETNRERQHTREVADDLDWKHDR